MGGGNIQLVSKGPQDFHLITNPQITFFKKVYRRHTNFSFETRRIYFVEKHPHLGLKILYNNKKRWRFD